MRKKELTDIETYPGHLEITGDICNGGPCLSRTNPSLIYDTVDSIKLSLHIDNEDLYKENVYQSLEELFNRVLECYR